jgi:hypothetical protein
MYERRTNGVRTALLFEKERTEYCLVLLLCWPGLGSAPRFGERGADADSPSGSGSGNTKLCLVWERCTVREYEIVQREYEDASRGLLYGLHLWDGIASHQHTEVVDDMAVGVVLYCIVLYCIVLYTPN